MRREARLDEVQEDGRTVRQHQVSLLKRPKAQAKSRERAERLLTPLEVHPGMQYMLDWFEELGLGRSYDDNGRPEPFGWSDVDCWARHMGRHPGPHEVQALFWMDRAERCPGPDNEEAE